MKYLKKSTPERLTGMNPTSRINFSPSGKPTYELQGSYDDYELAQQQARITQEHEALYGSYDEQAALAVRADQTFENGPYAAGALAPGVNDAAFAYLSPGSGHVMAEAMSAYQPRSSHPQEDFVMSQPVEVENSLQPAPVATNYQSLNDGLTNYQTYYAEPAPVTAPTFGEITYETTPYTPPVVEAAAPVYQTQPTYAPAPVAVAPQAVDYTRQHPILSNCLAYTGHEPVGAICRDNARNEYLECTGPSEYRVITPDQAVQLLQARQVPASAPAPEPVTTRPTLMQTPTSAIEAAFAADPISQQLLQPNLMTHPQPDLVAPSAAAPQSIDVRQQYPILASVPAFTGNEPVNTVVRDGRGNYMQATAPGRYTPLTPAHAAQICQQQQVAVRPVPRPYASAPAAKQVYAPAPVQSYQPEMAVEHPSKKLNQVPVDCHDLPQLIAMNNLEIPLPASMKKEGVAKIILNPSGRLAGYRDRHYVKRRVIIGGQKVEAAIYATPELVAAVKASRDEHGPNGSRLVWNHFEEVGDDEPGVSIATNCGKCYDMVFPRLWSTNYRPSETGGGGTGGGGSKNETGTGRDTEPSTGSSFS